MASINAPGGPFVGCPHPNVGGRERELRSLADGVRRLIGIANSSVPSAAQTAAAVDRLAPLVTRLEGLVPEPLPPRLHFGSAGLEPHAGTPYDVVHGLYNPMAVPVAMRYEPPEAIGDVTFGTAYEGPPGRVHGAVLVGAFDMIFSSANALTGVTGPTATLRVHYEGATRIGRPAQFRARQVAVEGRRIRVEGELRQDGTIVCRAEGMFIQVDRDRLSDMGRAE